MSEAAYSACPECWRKAAPSKRGGMPHGYRASRACAFCKPGVSTGLTVLAEVPAAPGSHGFEKPRGGLVSPSSSGEFFGNDRAPDPSPSTDSTVEIACDVISTLVETAFGGDGGDFGGGGAGGDY